MAGTSDKKQFPLRLPHTLWNEIRRWADDDLRSVNGQIEYILSEAVKRRRKAPAKGAPASASAPGGHGGAGPGGHGRHGDAAPGGHG